MKIKAQNQFSGAGALFLSGFFYALYGVLTRYVLYDMGLFYQSASRYFVGLLIFFLLVKIFGSLKPIKRKDIKWFVALAFFAFAVNIPFYIAVNNLPLGTTLFLFYASSLISSYLFGFFALKEKLSRIKIIVLFLAIIGIYLIYKENFQLTEPIFCLSAILSGSFFGFYSTANKTINLKYPTLQINLINYLLVFLLTTPFIFINRETINLNFLSFSWIINIIYALVMVFASFCTVYGFKYIEAQKGSLILLSELIFVVINGFIFFKEIPGVSVIIGGIIILISLILPNIQFRISKINNT